MSTSAARIFLSSALFLCISTISIATVEAQANERASVVKVFAPLYSPVTFFKKGSVRVDVKVRADGVVKSAKATEQPSIPVVLWKTKRSTAIKVLRVVCENAALRWRFAATANGAKKRTLTLTFVFGKGSDYEQRETVFTSPYQVELNVRKPKEAIDDSRIAATPTAGIGMVSPFYPPIATHARVEGAIVVDVRVDSAGQVISARPVAGHPLLRRSAAAAAGKWRFSVSEGRQERVLQVTFIYRISEEEEHEGITFIPPYQVEIARTPRSIHSTSH